MDLVVKGKAHTEAELIQACRTVLSSAGVYGPRIKTQDGVEISAARDDGESVVPENTFTQLQSEASAFDKVDKSKSRGIGIVGIVDEAQLKVETITWLFFRSFFDLLAVDHVHEARLNSDRILAVNRVDGGVLKAIEIIPSDIGNEGGLYASPGAKGEVAKDRGLEAVHVLLGCVGD